MDALVLIIEIVLCLFSLFMIAVVLLQSGRSAGLTGDIAGGAETFLGKSKAKSYEGTLKKLTKIAAVGMMVLAVALVLIQVYGMNTTSTDTTTATETPAPLTAPTEEAQSTAEATADAAVDNTAAADSTDEADSLSAGGTAEATVSPAE